MKVKRFFVLLTAAVTLGVSAGCGGEAYDTYDRGEHELLSATEPETKETPQPKTEKPTEAPTKAPTEPPTKAPTEPPTEKPTQTPTEAILASTIRPEVKESIDAYEKFMDDYISFMNNFNSLSEMDAVSLLSDYTKFMADYAINVDKFDALDSDLTEAEEEYYTEVELRVLDKLLKFEANLASDIITDPDNWDFDFDTDWDDD